MGWLKELMLRTEPRVSSYGELARTCLTHRQWPADIQPKPRSLAALFSKFDRGIELDWLADREPVQWVLSQVLHCPLKLIQSELEKELAQSDEQLRRWRLPDVPMARPVDLLEEDLPPGIPSVLRHPMRWGRLWYSAGAQHGTALVGAWLKARGRAQTLVARTWEDVAHQLDSELPVFVELRSGQVPSAPTRENICIAVPGPQPALELWQRIEPPPVSDYIGELLEWLEKRLPQDGYFDQHLAASWFDPLIRNRTVDCLQTALGLAGLLDELGVANVRGRTLLALATEFIERRMLESSVGANPETQWLKRFGFEALAGMAQRALTESDVPWDAGRTQDEWLALVPDEFQRGVDVEWASLTLARAGTQVTVGELEKALAHVSPGAFRVIRALLAARILEEQDTGLLRVTPRWLQVAARQHAEQSISSQSPLEWGEALLRPHARERLRSLLFERARSADNDLLEQTLDLEDAEDSPAFVLAVETLVLAVGHACLQGVEYDAEQLAGLLELQNELLLRFAQDWIAPRLLCRSTDRAEHGAWLLSLWAIAEQADDIETQRPPLLDPWASHAFEESTLRNALDHVQAYLQSLPDDDETLATTVLRTFELVARLLQIPSDVRPGSSETLHSLQLPTTIDTASPFPVWQKLSELHHGIAALHARATDWPTLAQAVWASWRDASMPACQWLSPADPRAVLFWPHLPDALFEELLEREHPFVSEHVEQHLNESCWLKLLEHHYADESVPNGRLRPTAAERVPEAVFERAVSGAAAHRDLATLKVLWSRAPELLLQRSFEVLDTGLGSDSELQLARSLFASAPAPLRARLVTGLRQRFLEWGVGHPLVDFARPWLHEQVCGRHSSWREAYSLLAEIETRLRRVRQARAYA